MEEIKRANKVNNNELYTGFWIAKLSGFLYDKTWTSLFHITRLVVMLILSIIHMTFPVIFIKNIDIIEKMLMINYLILLINCLLMVFPLIYNSENNKLFCSIIKTEFHQPKMELSPKQLGVKQDTERFLRKFAYNLAFFYYSAMLLNLGRRYIFEGISMEILPLNGWIPFEVNSWLKYPKINTCPVYVYKMKQASTEKKAHELFSATNPTIHAVYFLCRFIAVFIFQILITISALQAHIGFLITFVIHTKSLCGQFEILSIHIQDTFNEVYIEEGKQLTEKNSVQQERYIQYRMKFAIQQHSNLLRYFKIYQDTYNMFLLIFAISTGAMICTVVYVITDPSTTLVLLIICFGCLLIPELSIIGIYCWFGQQLTNKYKYIQEAAYNTPWYIQTVSTQKLLLNLLTACQRECIVKGGGVQEFSMLGLSELLQASFSYFNVLKAMRQ